MSADAGPASTGRVRTALAALVFGPPAVLAALRAWLAWQDGRHPPAEAFALAPLPPPSLAALFLPWVLGAVALLLCAALLALWWRRGGARAVRRLLGAAWALAWLAGVAGLWAAHANSGALQALPEGEARVLGLRARPATLHQEAGSELVLDVVGFAGPQRVRIAHAGPALWRPGERLRVRLARGRFYGLYLVGWEPQPPAPARP